MTLSHRAHENVALPLTAYPALFSDSRNGYCHLETGAATYKHQPHSSPQQSMDILRWLAMTVNAMLSWLERLTAAVRTGDGNFLSVMPPGGVSVAALRPNTVHDTEECLQ